MTHSCGAGLHENQPNNLQPLPHLACRLWGVTHVCAACPGMLCRVPGAMPGAGPGMQAVRGTMRVCVLPAQACCAGAS